MAHSLRTVCWPRSAWPAKFVKGLAAAGSIEAEASAFAATLKELYLASAASKMTAAARV